jgi:hypothetical protein
VNHSYIVLNYNHQQLLPPSSNNEVTYRVRAHLLDKNRDGHVIAEMKKRNDGLLIEYRNEYFTLFGMRGESPNVPAFVLMGYETVFLVKEIRGASRIQVLEVLSGRKSPQADCR